MYAGCLQMILFPIKKKKCQCVLLKVFIMHIKPQFLFFN